MRGRARRPRRPSACLAAFAMPSRITDDAASSTDGGTSARSPSIDHVAGSCQRSRTLRSSSSIGCAVAGATAVRFARTPRISSSARRSSRTAWRSASAASDGAISARWASALELEDGCGDHLRQPVVDRVRETGPVALDRSVEVWRYLEDLIGSSEALGGRGLAPERHCFHRPPSFCMPSHVPLSRLKGARRCIGAHLRSLPPSQGMPKSVRLVLISVVRGGGLNPPLTGA